MNETDRGLEPELYDGRRRYSAIELCRVCRLSHERLIEYVAHGVVASIDARSGEPDEGFGHADLQRLLRAVRVRRELEVELSDLALVVDLMETLERQRRELARLRREVGFASER